MFPVVIVMLQTASIVAEAARPLGNPAEWVGVADYPPAAMAVHAQGVVTMRLTIGRAGRLTGCAIIQSSGSAVLDSTSCHLLETRARYAPARDGHGRAVASEIVRRIRWQIPEAVPNGPDVALRYVGALGAHTRCFALTAAGEREVPADMCAQLLAEPGGPPSHAPMPDDALLPITQGTGR